MSNKLKMFEGISECAGGRSSKGSPSKTAAQPFLFRVYLHFLNSRKIAAAQTGVKSRHSYFQTRRGKYEVVLSLLSALISAYQ